VGSGWIEEAGMSRCLEGRRERRRQWSWFIPAQAHGPVGRGQSRL